MRVAACDICERKLNVDNINVQYKVKAKKHAFDGWSSTFDHNVDVCDRCVAMIHKLVNEGIAKLCGCGFADECYVHCNHELDTCPGEAYKGSDVVVSSPDTTTESVKSAKVRGEDNQEKGK